MSLEELLGLDSAPTPRPAPVTSVRDLEGPDRKRAQQDSLWQALAAMGALVGGDQRRAAAGIGDIQDAQQRVLADVNQRSQTEWEEAEQQRAHDFDREQRRQKAASLLGMYEAATEGEDPGGAFAQRAERAARAGSMSELEQLRGEKGKRAAAKAKGLDPDAWDVNERLQKELEAELKRAADAAAWEGEKGRLTEKQKLEREAKLETEEEMRKRRLGTYKPPEYEPLDRIRQKAEIQAQVSAKYREGGAAGIKGRLGQAGGKWGWITPPSAENPRGKFIPIDGQPEAAGSDFIFTIKGTPYAIDRDNPDAGARELPMKDLGAGPPAAGAPAPKGGAPKKPAAGADRKKAQGDAAVKALFGDPEVQKTQGQAAQKLAAVTDPGRRKSIDAARAAGYSDSEIAAFLGLQ